MQSFPMRTTGQERLHSWRHFLGLHLSALTIAILWFFSALNIHVIRTVRTEPQRQRETQTSTKTQSSSSSQPVAMVHVSNQSHEHGGAQIPPDDVGPFQSAAASASDDGETKRGVVNPCLVYLRGISPRESDPGQTEVSKPA